MPHTAAERLAARLIGACPSISDSPRRRNECVVPIDRCEFCSNVPNMLRYRSRGALCFVSPDLFVDLVSRIDPIWRRQKQLDDFKLPGGQRDSPIAQIHFVPGDIHGELAVAEDCSTLSAVSTLLGPQVRPHSSDKLAYTDRFHDVIVATDHQTSNPVILFSQRT